MLEEEEKNLEEYKKALELKDKQLSDIKNILQGDKKSCDSLVTEKKELKNYIANIKQRYQQYQQQQQNQYMVVWYGWLSLNTNWDAKPNTSNQDLKESSFRTKGRISIMDIYINLREYSQASGSKDILSKNF